MGDATAEEGKPSGAWISRGPLFYVLLALLLVALFEFLRLGMILRNASSARGLSAGQLLTSFFYGLRFDVAIACFTTLPVVILGHLTGLRHSRRAQRIIFVALQVAVTIIIFLLLAEYEFFNEFQTRYNQLAFQYFDQPKTVVGMVWYNYPVVRYVLACAVLSLAFGLCVRWLMKRCFAGMQPGMVKAGSELTQMGILCVLWIIGMRGGLQAEPLRWGDAYHSNSEFVNQMSLNGMFALGQSAMDHFRFGKSSAAWLRRMPPDEAMATARKLIISPSETLIDP